MHIREWFVSRHTRFVEAELAALKLELARVRSEERERLDDLKKTHAEELSRAISDVAYHRDEVERLRRFLLPGMAPAYDVVREASSPSAPELVPDKYAGLTPFQRMQAKDLEAQDEEIKRRKQVPAPPAESTAA